MRKLFIVILFSFIGLCCAGLLFNATTTNTNINIEEAVKAYFQKIKGTSTPFLMDVAIEGKKVVKVAAVRQLGDLKDKDSIDLLTAIMTYIVDPSLFNTKYARKKNFIPEFDGDVRAEAALALGKINDANSLPKIGNTLIADRNSKVKQYCLKAFSLMKNKDATPYIEKYIRYELQLDKMKIDNDVVREAARALGDIGHKNAFFLLIEITQTESLQYEPKREALRALEK
ncbi:MAG: hypothetical protein PHF84_11165, partial [bacterium]|nr:hypothetical protein [bacterium]